MEVVIFLSFLFFWGDCDLYDHMTHNPCIVDSRYEEVGHVNQGEK